MRRAPALLALALAAGARAQAPDVRVKADVAFTPRVEKYGGLRSRFYDLLGRPSTVSLQLLLEPGFRLFASQRLERIPGTGSGDFTDEVYLEDPGIWRIGKQYLPFGTSRLLSESVVAARLDTDLVVEGLPVAFALVDGGSGYPRGYVARIGDATLGASAALGDHFGVEGTALGVIRRPEDAPGRGRGWGLALGAHAARRVRNLDLSAELVALRRGETPLDLDTTVFDLYVGYRPLRRYSVGVGYTRSEPESANYLRFSASVPLDSRTSLEPLLRFRNDSFFDLGITLRFRL